MVIIKQILPYEDHVRIDGFKIGISAFRLGYSLLILRSKNFYGDCLLTGETFLF